MAYLKLKIGKYYSKSQCYVEVVLGQYRYIYQIIFQHIIYLVSNTVALEFRNTIKQSFGKLCKIENTSSIIGS